MKSERCEFCGRYGAQRHVVDRGPNGHGGRRTDTRYTCDPCEERVQREMARYQPPTTGSTGS